MQHGSGQYWSILSTMDTLIKLVATLNCCAHKLSKDDKLLSFWYPNFSHPNEIDLNLINISPSQNFCVQPLLKNQFFSFGYLFFFIKILSILTVMVLLYLLDTLKLESKHQDCSCLNACYKIFFQETFFHRYFNSLLTFQFLSNI